MNSQRNRLLVLALVVLAVGLGWKLLHREPQPNGDTTQHTSTDRHSPTDLGVSNSGNTGAGNPNGSVTIEPGLGISANVAVGSDAAVATEQGRVWFRAGWGAGPNQLAHDRPSEGAPEAPMSFTVAPDGTVWVLDQLNHRLQHFSRDGRPMGSHNLALLTPQDLTATADGRLLVLDRAAEKTVVVLGPDGQERGRIALEGARIAHTGSVTGVFADGDSVYVERQHGPLVRIGDTNGQSATERDEVPGRPTRDGHAWVTAGITDLATGRMYINAVARPSRDHLYTRELLLNTEVRHVLMLDSDKQGVVYLGVDVITRSGAVSVDGGGGVETERVLLLCIDQTTGRPTGQINLPANTTAEETMRDMVALDEGGILYAVRNAEGVEYRQYHCNPREQR